MPSSTPQGEETVCAHLFEGTHPFECVRCGKAADLFEMKFGPRVYTPAEVEQIADASANRQPPNAPPLALFDSKENPDA